MTTRKACVLIGLMLPGFAYADVSPSEVLTKSPAQIQAEINAGDFAKAKEDLIPVIKAYPHSMAAVELLVEINRGLKGEPIVPSVSAPDKPVITGKIYAAMAVFMGIFLSIGLWFNRRAKRAIWLANRNRTDVETKALAPW
jgi:hypothetical protein